MVRSASIFSQLLGVFSRIEFQKAVKEHNAERYDKEIDEADGAGAVEGMSNDQRLARVQELRRERFWKLADAVYAERGWDSEGVPTDELLERVGLTDPKFTDVGTKARGD